MDVRVVSGVCADFVPDLKCLRVVPRCDHAQESQLEVRHLRFREPVAVDHADRVLPAIEPGDLCNQRAVPVDPDSFEGMADEAEVGRAVFGLQRVDRGRDHPAPRPRHFGEHVVVHREQNACVRGEPGRDSGRQVRVRVGGVDVAYPDARFRRRKERRHRQSLGVVHDPDVGLCVAACDLFRDPPHVADVGVPQVVRHFAPGPLQLVVHLLGDVEERFVAAHH